MGWRRSIEDWHGRELSQPAGQSSAGAMPEAHEPIFCRLQPLGRHRLGSPITRRRHRRNDRHLAGAIRVQTAISQEIDEAIYEAAAVIFAELAAILGHHLVPGHAPSRS